MKKNLFLWLAILLYSRLMLYSQQNEPFEIDIQKNTIVITEYGGEEKNIQIPAKINLISVTVIGDTAFYAKGLTSVIIHKGITAINNAAFSNNQLRSM